MEKPFEDLVNELTIKAAEEAHEAVVSEKIAGDANITGLAGMFREVVEPDHIVKGGDLVKVTLVPVEVFGTESYGLADAVSPWSDCNRARGHIYRRDEDENVPYRNPSEVITVYVPRNELPKFDESFGDG